jgi:hypothetical protein
MLLDDSSDEPSSNSRLEMASVRTSVVHKGFVELHDAHWSTKQRLTVTAVTYVRICVVFGSYNKNLEFDTAAISLLGHRVPPNCINELQFAILYKERRGIQASDVGEW